MILAVALSIFVDVGIMKEGFVVLDSGKGVGDLRLPARKAFTSVPCKTMPASTSRGYGNRAGP
jgi:hypothetical protein